MRSAYVLVLLGLLSLSVFATSFFSVPVYALHRPSEIAILEPSPSTLVDATKTTSQLFQTNITIRNAVDVFNFQVTLSYNASVVNLLGMNVVNTYFDQCIDGSTGALKIGTPADPCSSATFDQNVYATLSAGTPTSGQNTLAYSMLGQASGSPQPIPLTCTAIPPITSLTCPTAMVRATFRVVRDTSFSKIHILLDTEDPVAGSFVADSKIQRTLYNTQDGFFSNIAAMVAPVPRYVVTPTTPDTYPNATIGSSVGFDATSSTGAVVYKWDFGDGTPMVSGASPTTSHTYNPTVPTPSVSIAENTTVALKFKAIRLTIDALDPGGFIARTVVDWGDGTVIKLPPVLNFPGATPRQTQVTYAYSRAGSFLLNVTVTNAVAVRSVLTVNGTAPGTQSSATMMIILSPGRSVSGFEFNRIITLAPVVSFTADKTSAFKGDTITLSISSSDPDGVVSSTRVDWGDGTVHTLPGAAFSDTHSYVNKGVYTANVTVTDDDGSKTSRTSALTIQDRAPVAGFSWTPVSPAAGDTVTFRDSSTDPDGTITAWAWDFGDGTTATLKDSTHKYAVSGTFTVKLTVTDNDGSANTLSQTITVQTPSLFASPLVLAGIGGAAVVVLALLTWLLVIRKRRMPTPSKSPL